MENISIIIRNVNHSLGKFMAWLVVAMTLTTVSIILLRLFWQHGSIAMQESVIYMHSALFLLTMAYTLSADAHVRVDVCYRSFSSTQQAWINALGSIVFLLPFATVLCAISWNFALRSWAIDETSANPGGLPFIYLLKSLIPLSGCLLVLQAIGQVLHNIAVLMANPGHCLRKAEAGAD